MKYRIWICLAAAAALVCNLSPTTAGVVKSGDKPEKKHLSKNDQLAQAYREGLVITYLDAGGKIKMLLARNADDLEKAKEKIQRNYDKKKAVYDKGRENYLKKNPEMKYSQLPPVEPTFKPAEPDIKLRGDRITSVTPKDNFYALYKVEADGKTTYEAGYSFSDIIQRQKHERKFIQKYNAWVRGKKKGEEPTEPKYEKVADELSKPMAGKAQAGFTAWQKKHTAWEKAGQKGEEPQQPDAAEYKESDEPNGRKAPEGKRTSKKPADK